MEKETMDIDRGPATSFINPSSTNNIVETNASTPNFRAIAASFMQRNAEQFTVSDAAGPNSPRVRNYLLQNGKPRSIEVPGDLAGLANYLLDEESKSLNIKTRARHSRLAAIRVTTGQMIVSSDIPTRQKRLEIFTSNWIKEVCDTFGLELPNLPKLPNSHREIDWRQAEARAELPGLFEDDADNLDLLAAGAAAITINDSSMEPHLPNKPHHTSIMRPRKRQQNVDEKKQEAGGRKVNNGRVGRKIMDKKTKPKSGFLATMKAMMDNCKDVDTDNRDMAMDVDGSERDGLDQQYREIDAHSPMDKHQTRQNHQLSSNMTKINPTMPRAGNRFASLPKESFDLRYWPSKTAPEKPSTSPVRNYLLHEWPPYKTELPSDLRRVQLYFETDYKDMYPHPKIISVHIGTGETMLSEGIPPTRRLWNRFIHEWLSLVHYTLVKWQPDPALLVEPHPDDDFFTPPRPSAVFGTDFPSTDDTTAAPPRRDDPSRDDIMADYFRTLQGEGKKHKASMRDRRQQMKDAKSTNAEADADGDVNMGDSGYAKKPNNNSKKRRQKRQLNERLAAKAVEDAKKMQPAEREGFQSMAGEMGGALAGGSVDETKRTVQDGLLGHGYTANTQLLDMPRPATAVDVSSFGDKSVAQQDVADTRPFDTRRPASGASILTVYERSVASQGMVNTEETTDVAVKPVTRQMHHLTLQHGAQHGMGEGLVKEDDELDMAEG
ncbi:hypothetical protein JOL62DRAFT_554784 [Phyllosticta paracitricarpa]|uniref:Uncharacterized protein n=2 Tax=Phyllosticta TaxID=121621 RepID=A0ABR1LN15_9PEZI